MDRSSAARVYSERIAQIQGITQLLLVRIGRQLEEDPQADGHLETVAAIEDAIVDTKMATRAQLERFISLARAQVDQEVEARKEPE